MASDLVHERENAISDEYGCFGDPQELFEYIIAKNKNASPLEKEFKREEFLVKGCVSSLWLAPSFRDGRCFFKTDADSIITRGISALVCQLYSGLTPDEILSIDENFFSTIGLSDHLSLNRRNGLTQLIAKIRAFAQAVESGK